VATVPTGFHCQKRMSSTMLQSTTPSTKKPCSCRKPRGWAGHVAGLMSLGRPRQATKCARLLAQRRWRRPTERGRRHPSHWIRRSLESKTHPGDQKRMPSTTLRSTTPGTKNARDCAAREAALVDDGCGIRERSRSGGSGPLAPWLLSASPLLRDCRRRGVRGAPPVRSRESLSRARVAD
jgi:hypothetical protein